MTLPVFPSLDLRAFLGATSWLLAVVAALGANSAAAQNGETTAAAMAALEAPQYGEVRTADPYADRFPDSVLKTHEGRNVRFYDDLLKGKIVLINFMYATCKER